MKHHIRIWVIILASLASLSIISCKKYHSIYAADWKLISVNDTAVAGNGVLTMDEGDNFSWSWNGETTLRGTYATECDTIWFYNDDEGNTTERMEIWMVNNNDLILRGCYSRRNPTDTIKVAFDRISL